MTELNRNQEYLVTEFIEDYRAGRLSRRSFIRRIAFRESKSLTDPKNVV